jgi:molybdate transport repressor ModE-like protein
VKPPRVRAEEHGQWPDDHEERDDQKLHPHSLPAPIPLAQVGKTLILITQNDHWPGLELRHLVALEAVAREGSFGRAARKLGYTQSAVSQQIAALERIVGEQLVVRPGGPRPVSLTEAGTLLLRHAEAIVARLSAAQADLAALADGAAGPLRVGVFQSVGQHILPEVLRRFATAWPRINVRLTESASDVELLELVERGELDLAFADLPLTEGPFEALELLRDPYVLVVPADSPLADRETPPGRAEIARLDLIGYRQCRSLNQIAASLPGGLRFVFRSDHNGTVQGLVGAGVGAALIPRLAADSNDDRVVLIDLGSRFPPRLIAIAWHRDRYRTDAARDFVDAAREVCAELEAVPALA